jgi:hypothetical protein
MASQTTFECDGCSRSISDPGTITELTVRTYDLKDGSRYFGKAEYKEFDLCPSCTTNVSTALKRALPNLS